MFPLIYFLLLPLSLLPLRLLYAIGDLLYLLLYYCVGYRKQVVRANLAHSFPEKSGKELKMIERRYFHHLCNLLVEGVKMLGISRRNVLRRYRCTNPELLREYAEKKQSILLMSAHYNNWEWMVLSLEMQTPLHGVGVGKENSNKSFERIINRFRTRYGTEVVFASNVRETMRHYADIGKACTYMMLSDQTPASAKRAFLLPSFLHQPTDMIYGSEYFAKKYGFPVLYYRVDRPRRGRYTWTIEKISDRPQEEPYGEIIRRYAEKLQRDIREKPEYWLWSHRRWKHREEVERLLREIRPATEADLPAILAMYEHSRSVMRAAGNTVQWVGYPTAEQVRQDIASGCSMLIVQSGKPVGTFAPVPGKEPTYGRIERGRWLDDSPYTTFHRLAAAPGTKGIADTAFRFAKQQSSHLRADTHTANSAMRHILEKEGFVYCGIVFMEDGSERLAYEWWRWDEVTPALKKYVEEEILPQYDRFDAAHRRDHILRVIARSMLMNWKYCLLPDMVYAAAAMHDLGVAEGRELHHLSSGKIIRNDKRLQQWFAPEAVEEIAQAAEDHRASATAAPRSLLGKIIAEADRDVEPERIIRRTVEYGLGHYPELSPAEQRQRTLQHLQEKYAEGGYIKLWLPDSPNAAPLEELRELIRDKGRVIGMIDRFLNENFKS